jgi:hypothetical protein
LVLILAISVTAAITGTTLGAFSATTSNSANSFQASSIFPCGSIAPLWMNGFEHGYASTSGSGQFSAINGSVTVDSNVARASGYSLLVDDTSLLAASNVQFPVSGSTVVARFAVRLASAPSGSVGLAFIEAGAIDLVFGYNSGTQKFELTSSATVASSATVSPGTWYWIDLRARFSNTSDWRINGVDQTSLTTAAGTPTAIGWGSTPILQRFTANYDDIIVSQNSGDYPFGDGRILRLNPVSNTYPVTEFQDNDNTPVDANSWQNIDDLPMTSTVDYIKQITTNSTYVQVDFNNPGECVKAVFATLAYSNATAGSNNGKTSIFDGGTERIVYSGAMDATALTYRTIYVVPASSPWTETTINGVVARIGYSTDVTQPPRWQALGLEYETAPE